MTDLKPCAHCGETPELHDYTAAPAAAWVLVHRNKACVIAPVILNFPTREDALERWNRRPHPTAPDDTGEVVLYGIRNVDTGRVMTRTFRSHDQASASAIGRSDTYAHFEVQPLFAAPPSLPGREELFDLIESGLDVEIDFERKKLVVNLSQSVDAVLARLGHKPEGEG